MDFSLRCNSLACRKQLNDQAVVTTCCHIFCNQCSQELNLTSPTGGTRICPACDTSLPNLDDAVSTKLNPSEDYKTSVLSGLSPGIIMECAGRGLNFWSYQATQEIVYQEYLAKSLADKYTTLSTQMDKLVHEANSEISNLQNKLAAMQLDQEHIQRKNHELVEAFREKSRRQNQTQELYDNLKKKGLRSQVATAASESVEHFLNQSSVNGDAFGDGPSHTRMGMSGLGTARKPTQSYRLPVDYQGVEQVHSRQRSGSTGSGSPQDPTGNMAPPLNRLDGQGKSLRNAHSGREHVPQSLPLATPSQHRLRLPTPRQPSQAFSQQSTSQSSSFTAHTPLSTPRSRQPLNGLSINSVNNPNLSGYGMIAGLKVGREQAFGLNGTNGDSRTGRARVVQRSSTNGFGNGPSISRAQSVDLRTSAGGDSGYRSAAPFFQ